jgi:hypothetical protein
MTRQTSDSSPWLAGAVCGVLAACAAQADTVVTVGTGGALTATTTWADTAANTTPNPVYGTGTNNGITPAVINNLIGNPAGTYTFGNTIYAPNGSYTGFTVTDLAQGQAAENIGFLDSYVINIPSAMANSSVFSLNLSSQLGLSDLTMRLYDYSSANGYQVNAAGSVSNAQLIDNWSQSTNGSPVSSSILNIGTLQAGEYVLEVGGLETGGVSGTYSGQLNLTPVPLPAAAWLMVSGMGAFSSLRRRRRS